MYQQEEDVIIRDSNKQFRLRINGYLRGIGIAQIIGTRDYLEIIFIGGDLNVRIPYPNKLKDLSNSIEKALLLETELSRTQIDNTRFYINEYVNEIESFMRMK